MSRTLNRPLPDPGLTDDPPRQSDPNIVEEDSDSEDIIVIVAPERQQVQAPPRISLEPASQTRSTESHSPGTLPPGSKHGQDHGSNDRINVLATAEPNIVQARPKRNTVGQHSNPFHLPRSVNQIFATLATNSQVPHAANYQIVQTVFRPWL